MNDDKLNSAAEDAKLEINHQLTRVIVAKDNQTVAMGRMLLLWRHIKNF